VLKKLIDFYNRRISGFNERSLTFDDLVRECNRSGITILTLKLRRARGGALWANEDPYLILSSSLSEPDLIITGFHELYHLQCNPPGAEILFSDGNLSDLRSAEQQANAVGLVALMPDFEVVRMSVDRIKNYYGIGRELAQRRHDILWRKVNSL